MIGSQNSCFRRIRWVSCCSHKDGPVGTLFSRCPYELHIIQRGSIARWGIYYNEQKLDRRFLALAGGLLGLQCTAHCRIRDGQRRSLAPRVRPRTVVRMMTTSTIVMMMVMMMMVMVVVVAAAVVVTAATAVVGTCFMILQGPSRQTSLSR